MPNKRRKTLLLGVSYPDINQEIQRKGYDWSDLDSTREDAVETAIELVDRRILTEMDGRDLARCIATENTCKTDVYTVSQENGAMYRSDRHLDANFNRPRVIRSLADTFQVAFDEIILDYFWIPSGWDGSHWKSSFFGSVLPQFLDKKLLTDTGKVYLPFCLHCFKEVMVAKNKLLRHYNIAFLTKKELSRISLWSGTQAIDSWTMQRVLGKRIDQEEKYCTFQRKDVDAVEVDLSIKTSTLTDIIGRIRNFEDIRFIELSKKDATAKRGKILGLRSKAAKPVSTVSTSPTTPSTSCSRAVVTPSPTSSKEIDVKSPRNVKRRLDFDEPVREECEGRSSSSRRSKRLQLC